MNTSWNPDTNQFSFETERISGILDALIKSDGEWDQNMDTINHRLSKVVHKPSKTLVSPDEAGPKRFGPCQSGLVTWFRVLAKGSYLTELRVTPCSCESIENGMRFTWEPTVAHQARIVTTLIVKEPNIIDLDIEVVGYGDYEDYEVLLCAYLKPGFKSGAYVTTFKDETRTPVQIRPKDDPSHHKFYNFYPRDVKGGQMLWDGRHQIGRYFWYLAIGRLYALPLGFYSDEKVDCLLMGRPEDVYAVGVTYDGDEANDNVADHRSIYLSLFGKDLKPGAGLKTQARLVIDDFAANQEDHILEYDKFIDEFKDVDRTFRVNPKLV